MERKVGVDGGSGHGKGGEDAPADVLAYGRWVPFASQMGGGRGKGLKDNYLENRRTLFGSGGVSGTPYVQIWT